MKRGGRKHSQTEGKARPAARQAVSPPCNPSTPLLSWLGRSGCCILNISHERLRARRGGTRPERRSPPHPPPSPPPPPREAPSAPRRCLPLPARVRGGEGGAGGGGPARPGPFPQPRRLGAPLPARGPAPSFPACPAAAVPGPPSPGRAAPARRPLSPSGSLRAV